MDDRVEDAVKNYIKKRTAFNFPVEVVLLWVGGDWETVEKV